MATGIARLADVTARPGPGRVIRAGGPAYWLSAALAMATAASARDPAAGGGAEGAGGPGPQDGSSGTSSGPGDGEDDSDAPEDPGAEARGPGGPGSGDRDRPADHGPSVGAMITITVPHTALEGDFGPPGEVAGFGILDHADTRDAACTSPSVRGSPNSQCR